MCFALSLLYDVPFSSLMTFKFPSSGFLPDHFENICFYLFNAHSTSSQNSHLQGLAISWHCPASKSFRFGSTAFQESLQFPQAILTFLPAWIPWLATLTYLLSVPSSNNRSGISSLSPLLTLNYIFLFQILRSPNHLRKKITYSDWLSPKGSHIPWRSLPFIFSC